MPKRLTPTGEAAPPVEPVQTGATLPPKPPRKHKTPVEETVRAPGVKYIRNLHYVQARVTLTNGREILFEPRGQREDIDIVNLEEQQDPRYLANVGLIFEELELAEANAIIANQRHNIRKKQSTLFDVLRNEKGEAYTQSAARIEDALENQGVVVGRVEEAEGHAHQDKNVQVHRAGPKIVEAPGSPGHPATAHMTQDIPDSINPEEYSEFLAWKAFKEATK